MADDSEIDAFIDRYESARDRDRITLAWNGERGRGFGDANAEFRQAVIAVTLERLSTVPIDLVCDVYIALAETSAQAWGIHRDFPRFAEQLLRRGGPEYIETYMRGKSASFDASLAASRFQIDEGLAKSLLDATNARLAADVGDRALLDKARELFSNWIAATRKPE